MKTPVTWKGLRKYDDLDALSAFDEAWNSSGPRPVWHHKAQAFAMRSAPQYAIEAWRAYLRGAADGTQQVTYAWYSAGIIDAREERRWRRRFRKAMPVAARALDRATHELK